MLPLKPLPFIGLILTQAFFAAGCSEAVVTKAETKSDPVSTIPTPAPIPANAEGLRVVYGDAIPDFSPRSKNFSDVVIRGKPDAKLIGNIRILEIIPAPGTIQYRIYNAGNTTVSLEGESNAFDPQGVLTYSRLTRFPSRLNARQSAYATVDLNKEDEVRTNLTITVR